jgi:hypothetical protein
MLRKSEYLLYFQAKKGKSTRLPEARPRCWMLVKTAFRGGVDAGKIQLRGAGCLAQLRAA